MYACNINYARLITGVNKRDNLYIILLCCNHSNYSVLRSVYYSIPPYISVLLPSTGTHYLSTKAQLIHKSATQACSTIPCVQQGPIIAMTITSPYPYLIHIIYIPHPDPRRSIVSYSHTSLSMRPWPRIVLVV